MSNKVEKRINLIVINKGDHDSSVCLLKPFDESEEVILTERLSRKKHDGSWPILAFG